MELEKRDHDQFDFVLYLIELNDNLAAQANFQIKKRLSFLQ